MMKMLTQVAIAVVMALFSWIVLAQSLDINTATAQELQALKGIGPAKAAAIIEYRQKQGPFKSVDDLAHVPGIGAKTVDSLRGQLTVGAMQSQTPSSGMAPEKKPMDKPARGKTHETMLPAPKQ